MHHDGVRGRAEREWGPELSLKLSQINRGQAPSQQSPDL